MSYRLNPTLELVLEGQWRQPRGQQWRARLDPGERVAMHDLLVGLHRGGTKERTRLVDQSGRFMRDVGLLVRHDAVPTKVVPDLTLDIGLLPLVSRSARAELQTVRRKRTPLELNRLHVFFQHGTQRPRSKVTGIPGERQYPSGPRLIWVFDPGTQMWAFYRATSDQWRTLRALARGDVAPRELEPKLLATLFHARILVTRAWLDARAAMWSALGGGKAHVGKNVIVARDILPPLVVANLRSHTRALFAEGYFYCDEKQVRDRRRMKGEKNVLAKFLHQQSDALVRWLTGSVVLPSWNLISRYTERAELRKHVDRDQCAWNASLPIDMQPTSSEDAPWPLCVETDKVHRIRLALGDLALYQGSESPHWRRPLQRGRTETILLWFFVPLSFRGDLEPVAD